MSGAVRHGASAAHFPGPQRGGGVGHVMSNDKNNATPWGLGMGSRGGRTASVSSLSLTSELRSRPLSSVPASRSRCRCWACRGVAGPSSVRQSGC